MKKRILTIFVMCILAISTLMGCSPIKLKENPPKNAPVTSNGGMVVQKGDYIYFTNGLVKTSSLSNGDNKYNKVTYGSICRVKTNNTTLDYSTTTEKNDEGEEEEVKTLNVEVVVPKIVGCETCEFYIFDDYIYYASPTTEKDKTGKSRFDLITFFCCKIDCSSTKKLYAVDSYGENAKFNMFKVGDYVYLEVFDGTNINIVTIKNNKVKSNKVVSKGSEISSVVFPTIDTYMSSDNQITTTNGETLVAENDMYVYYVRSVLDTEKYSDCNVLCKASVETAEEEIIVADNKNTITLVDYYNGNIFYKVSDKHSFSETYIIYASNIETLKNKGITTEDQILFIESDSPFVIKSKKYVGVIISENNQLKMGSKGNDFQIISEDLALTILGVIGDNIYCYNEMNQLVVVNIPTKDQLIINDMEKINFEQSKKFDLCGNYIYCYQEYKGESETGYYLNRFDIDDVVLDGEFIGILQDAHKSTETED